MAQATALPSEQPAIRLSWLTLLPGLLAMAALYTREASLLSPLPLLAVALVVSQFSAHRLEHSAQFWMFRLPLFIIVVLLGMVRPFPDVSGLYDARVICILGEILAVEMTLQGWRLHTASGRPGILMIPLSGLILLAAADSTEDQAIWYFTPVYMLCLALALPNFRPQPSEKTSSLYRRSAGAWIALGLALIFGVTTHVAFRVHRDRLTEWGMQMLRETPAPEAGSGALSTTPTLGASYGLQGSDVRSYRIEGPRGADLPEHLRVMAFDTYAHQNWLPGESSRTLSAEAVRRLPPARPPFWRVTRMLANDGVLIAPLETSGFDPQEQRQVRWSSEMGPLKSESPVPSAYLFSVGTAGLQGPFCAPPDAEELKRLLALPREMDPRVRDIAREAGGSASTPAAKAEAVAAYLPAHHRYSLSYRPGAGDPLSRFLLSDSAAHCEYFASSAVLLLRCLGVPARYVIGYYAHERDPDGQVIVRQRDAHAWAEAWIEGVGWITVEATPGDGRPDKTASISWWTRINEWFTDRVAALRNRLGRLGIAAVLVVAALVGMWIVWRNLPKKDNESGEHILIYSTPGEELTALATRFERICRQRGMVLAPSRTWEEAIDGFPRPEAGAPISFDLETGYRFVRAYSAVRWGGADAKEIQRLKEMLQAMEDYPRGT